MIKEVFLFTNRNLLVFDEKGEQIADIQRVIGWGTEWFEHEREEEALERIIQDRPKIYLANYVKGWKHEITVDEFCSLLGHGPWYWEKYKKSKANKEEEY